MTVEQLIARLLEEDGKMEVKVEVKNRFEALCLKAPVLRRRTVEDSPAKEVLVVL